MKVDNYDADIEFSRARSLKDGRLKTVKRFVDRHPFSLANKLEIAEFAVFARSEVLMLACTVQMK